MNKFHHGIHTLWQTVCPDNGFSRITLNIIIPKWSFCNNDYYIMFPTVFRILKDYNEGYMLGIVILGFGLSLRIAPIVGGQ